MAVVINDVIAPAEKPVTQQDLAKKALAMKKASEVEHVPPVLLTRKQLMNRWGLGSTALWNLERSGKGPPRTMIGLAVRYSIEDVEEFERKHRTPTKAA